MKGNVYVFKRFQSWLSFECNIILIFINLSRKTIEIIFLKKKKIQVKFEGMFVCLVWFFSYDFLQFVGPIIRTLKDCSNLWRS